MNTWQWNDEEWKDMKECNNIGRSIMNSKQTKFYKEQSKRIEKKNFIKDFEISYHKSPGPIKNFAPEGINIDPLWRVEWQIPHRTSNHPILGTHTQSIHSES